jgi:hypothetical protein
MDVGDTENNLDHGLLKKILPATIGATVVNLMHANAKTWEGFWRRPVWLSVGADWGGSQNKKRNPLRLRPF